MTSSRRARLFASLLVMAASAPPGVALPPSPYAEIVDTVRGLAAEQVGRKPADIDLVRSLAAQGFSENDLHELVIAINDEFGVVISTDELRRAKQNDPMPPLSVSFLARLVESHQQEHD